MNISPARAAGILLSFTLAFDAAAATFFVSSSADSGPGSLRQAILDANASPGRDAIVLQSDIFLSEVVMPSITDPVDISGARTPSGRHFIGSPTLFDDTMTRFRFTAGSEGSTLRTVEFGGSSHPAATLATTDVTVTDIVGPGAFFIVTGNRNIIGGPAEGDANQIGTLRIEHGDDNVVLRTSMENLVLLQSQGNTIGRPGAGNSIFHVFKRGDEFQTRPGNVFEGNTIDDYFGSNGSSVAGPATDTTLIGNTLGFVSLHGEHNAVIRDNIFSRGVRLTGDGAGVTILGNTFNEHHSFDPIDLGSPLTSFPPNDPAPDADTGPNGRQNYPVLSLAYQAGSSFVVEGMVTSAPLTPYEVELFANGVPVASFLVETDAAGNAPFAHSMPGLTPAQDTEISATATNRASINTPGNVRNSTSEMSRPIAISTPGTLAFGQSAYRVDEGAGTITITVRRTEGTDGTVTVMYATADESAIAPADYTSTSGTLIFGPGVMEQSFNISIAEDDVLESAETFTVTLSNATGGATLREPTVAVTIDDPALATAQVPALSWWGLLTLTAALGAAAVYRRV